MDGYFRDKKEVIQPGLIGDFILMKGYKYQFFLWFWLKIESGRLKMENN